MSFVLFITVANLQSGNPCSLFLCTEWLLFAGHCTYSRTRSIGLKYYIKRELNRSYWSKFPRSFLCSARLPLCKETKAMRAFVYSFVVRYLKGGKGRKEEFPFFSSLPEQSLIITSSSSLTVCTVKRDMVKSAVKGMDVSGRDNTTFCECNTLQPASQFF